MMHAAGTHKETQRQFWRESEGRWVDHVLIITFGSEPDKPRRWRHRTITTVTTVSEWDEGKS